MIAANRSGTPIGDAVAVLLARVVVPLYFALGAVLKIADVSAGQLPVALVKWAGALDFNLLYVFRLSIAGELIVAGVMILVARLARPAGLILLGLFLPVLIGDLALGAASCGCFGAVKISPWITLAVDGGLLLGLWWFGRNVPSLSLKRELPTAVVVAAGVWVIASFMIGFGVGGGAFAKPHVENSGEAESTQVALPADGYHMPDYGSWIGLSWADVPIAAWMTGDQILGTKVEYVLFYRKDCEHCHELMEAWFADELLAPTLAVAVPERDGFPTENLQPFPCSECRLAELPQGVDWFLQTPVLVRLRDGIVECAAEVTAAEPQCLEF